MRPILPLALALAACAPRPARPQPAAAGPAPSGLPAPLAALRDATGGAAWDQVHAIAWHGTIDVSGLHGTAEGLDDLDTGRHVSAVKLGPIDESDGYDGTTGWQRTLGGEVVVQDAPAAVALARTTAWLTRRGYLRAAGAAYVDLGARSEAGATYHVIQATPDGGAPIELWLDAGGMLARTRDREGTDTVTTTWSDWRAVGGVKVAFHFVVDPGDPRNVATIAYDDVHAVPAAAAAAFAAPHADADRVSFAGGKTSTQIPFELINNHIYVHATIDGQPVRVLVDTGGLNALTPAAAKKLGLTVEGAAAASGAGAAKVDAGFAHGKTLTVGDATLARPIFFVIDMGALADVEGVDADGLIGFEMLERLRVRIDYPASTLTLIEPAAFTPPAGAIAVPFELSDRTPIVQGTIDGVPGRFEVDTGSRLSLTTMAKFTRDHDLAGKYKPAFEAVTGWGVGGATRSAPVRFHEVTIGGAVVHDVVGDLFTGDKGPFANPDTAGNLGGGILHRFAVTFDYAAKVMYLEPGPHDAIDEREVYDRSGLFLLRAGAALKVVSLVPRGPADKAGVKEGDRITAIDGKPIATRTLPEWRAQLRDRAVGTKVTLRVERAGKARDVAITLAELVP